MEESKNWTAFREWTKGFESVKSLRTWGWRYKEKQDKTVEWGSGEKNSELVITIRKLQRDQVQQGLKDPRALQALSRNIKSCVISALAIIADVPSEWACLDQCHGTSEQCHVSSCRYSPTTLVLAISEVDDNQVGKFSFYTKESILKVNCVF